ncbi:MAG: RluA family pseudouridine synthase [Tepidisphaerales bacterium]
MTVEQRLRELFPTAKRTTLRRMVQTGRVRLRGAAVRRLAEVLDDPSQLEVLPRAPEPPRHRRGNLPIVYEDDDLLVLEKPPGLLTATTPRETRPTLLAKVTAYLARTAPHARVGLIHRLDRDARGLVVFSKNEAAYFALKAQLKARTLGRTYHAVVVGSPKLPEATLRSRLVEGPDGRVRSTTDPRKGEEAVTHYRVVRPAAGGTLLEVRLETGRKHQIRVHLAEAGHPIVGDVLYAPPPHNCLPLRLAATKLTLVHPRTGQTLLVQRPVPDDFG